MVSKVRRVNLEFQEPQELLVKEVFKVRRAFKVLLALRALKVFKVQMARKVYRDKVVRKVRRV